MDDVRKIPLIFANRVIRQFVDNQMGDESVIIPDDYMAMRLVFRKCQGSWERVSQGDIVHVCLLAKVVTAWGKTRGKKREIEVV